MYQNIFFIPLRKKAERYSHLRGCTNRPVSNKAVPPYHDRVKYKPFFPACIQSLSLYLPLLVWTLTDI